MTDDLRVTLERVPPFLKLVAVAGWRALRDGVIALLRFCEKWLTERRRARYGIAVMRILLGVVGFGLLWTNYPARSYLFGPASFWSGEQLDRQNELLANPLFGLGHVASGSLFWFTVVYLLAAALALGVVAGYRIRLVLPLFLAVYVGIVAQQHRRRSGRQHLPHLSLLADVRRFRGRAVGRRAAQDAPWRCRGTPRRDAAAARPARGTLAWGAASARLAAERDAQRGDRDPGRAGVDGLRLRRALQGGRRPLGRWHRCVRPVACGRLRDVARYQRHADGLGSDGGRGILGVHPAAGVVPVHADAPRDARDRPDRDSQLPRRDRAVPRTALVLALHGRHRRDLRARRDMACAGNRDRARMAREPCGRPARRCADGAGDDADGRARACAAAGAARQGAWRQARRREADPDRARDGAAHARRSAGGHRPRGPGRAAEGRERRSGGSGAPDLQSRPARDGGRCRAVDAGPQGGGPQGGHPGGGDCGPDAGAAFGADGRTRPHAGSRARGVRASRKVEGSAIRLGHRCLERRCLGRSGRAA